MASKSIAELLPATKCRLTLVVEFDTPTDMVEAVERIKDAGREHGEIVSCKAFITPGDVDFGN